MRPRIVYMGTPEFAVAPLAKLVESGYDVVGVVTVPDKPSGRGLKLNESDVKKYYNNSPLAQNAKLMQPVSLKEPGFISELESLNADLFIVVAFRMLPKVVWDMPSLGTFNLHGSLLPAYRGAAPINWAIINGEQKSGVTTFLIDEKIDTGNILLQRETPIGERENIGSLYSRLMTIGAELVTDTVDALINGITPKPQEGEIKDAPKLHKETCKIIWDRTEEEINERLNESVRIDRFVRGLSPYPCATTTISNGEKSFGLKIFDTLPIAERGSKPLNEAGKIESDNKTYLHITCADGSTIAVTELQLSGKRRVTIKEFLMGFRGITEYRAVQD